MERQEKFCDALEGLSWFQRSPKRFVRFRVGSAHTDISLHTGAALCHGHEGTNSVPRSTHDKVREKVCNCENARSTQRAWGSTRNTYLLCSHTRSALAALLEGISEILCVTLFDCNDFMVNKPAREENPFSFLQKKWKGMTHSWSFFFTLFCQPFNFPSFQETVCQILCQSIARYYLKCVYEQHWRHSIFCNHMPQHHSGSTQTTSSYSYTKGLWLLLKQYIVAFVFVSHWGSTFS